MTLAEFLAAHDYAATPVYRRIDGGMEVGTPTSTVYPAADAYLVPDVGNVRPLWGLADWRVTSVSGGSVWLGRRV